MKKKSKIAIMILVSMLLLATILYAIIGNPIMFIKTNKLEHSIKSIDAEMINFNEVVPFDWDSVYTFEPYMSKESIEKTIGFTSNDVKENYINEGMVHLIFVKDKKVVASILGYSEDLGYSIDFSSKITFIENAQFNVTISDGVVILTHVE